MHLDHQCYRSQVADRSRSQPLASPHYADYGYCWSRGFGQTCASVCVRPALYLIMNFSHDFITIYGIQPISYPHSRRQ